MSTLGKRTGLERPLYSKGREGSQDNLEAPRQWVSAGDEQPSRSLGMNEELRLYHSQLRQCKLFAQDGLVAGGFCHPAHFVANLVARQMILSCFIPILG